MRTSLELKVMHDRLEDFVIREFQKLRDEVNRQNLAQKRFLEICDSSQKSVTEIS